MINNVISMRRIMLLLFSVNIMLIAVEGENTTYEQDYVSFETTVNLKIFDVLLLDSDGIPIKGLTKDKFQLYIDGDKVDIDTFDIVNYKELA